VRVTVRSDALLATGVRLSALAQEVQEDAGRLAGVLAAAAAPRVRRLDDVGLVACWVRLEGEWLLVAGPGGAWGEALALDTLAAAMRAAARAYAGVERAVAALLVGVGAGADLASTVGWLDDWGAASAGRVSTERTAVVRDVAPTLRGPLVGEVGTSRGGRVPGIADLVAAGGGLDGGRVRVLQTARPGGGSAWVVVVPGTQEWSARAGANPFDLTTDVRAMTGASTVAAAAVTAALDRARARSPAAAPDDPVLLVGHSQGGILAAALASDPTFRRRHRVTHVVTSGSPVGLFAVPSTTRVLSLEHADDPVPRLDLTPNPAGASWLTVVAPARASPVDPARHALEGYVTTMRTLEDAPGGTIAGLDAWQASAGAFLGAPVLSVSEVVVERGWHNPRS
jgi:pimeloyl-ACP methyl ester carboxylesterase